MMRRLVGVMLVGFCSACGNQATLLDLQTEEPTESEQPPASDPAPEDAITEADPAELIDSVWLIVASNSTDSVFATAFAVDKWRLATNAHVVLAIVDILRSPSGDAIVFENETGASRNIEQMWIHPDYDENALFSPDVAMLQVNDPLQSWSHIAPLSVLQDISIFQEIRLCGFPADVTVLEIADAEASGSTFRPRGSCFVGNVTQLRPFSSDIATNPQTSSVVQHDIPTTGGTSGSPIVDDSGEVVAIHTSTTLDPTGSNRFAIRADSIQDLLDRIRQATIDPIEIPMPTPVVPPAPTSTLLPGVWEGTTDQNGSVTFRIQGDTLMSISFDWFVAGPLCSIGNFVECNPCDATIVGCDFSVGFVGGDARVNIIATDCTPTEVSGRILIIDVCGDTIEVSWSAYRVG